MNIQYSKWSYNDFKIFNQSIKNILDIQEGQLYFPIMSLFFYIESVMHNLLSHKKP